CICPSPTGEVRWGLMVICRSNLFLPLGKVRMGYPTGEARWGLMVICRSNLFLPFGKVRMGLRTRGGC
ncbi:hypothetical protein, partial [Prevotella pectinovora]|uniref:hypothetical protein n=1 Tax=Prevotella pectinovora TaxID=1602169 RepID=UPI0030791C96